MKLVHDWTPEERDQIESGVEDLRRRQSALRNLREDLGITQAQLAELLGVTQSNVSKIEARGETHLNALRKLVEHKGGRVKVIIELNGHETEWPFI